MNDQYRYARFFVHFSCRVTERRRDQLLELECKERDEKTVKDNIICASQAPPVKKFAESAMGAVTVNHEVDFIWQSDMTYENDFSSEADVATSEQLQQAAAVRADNVPSQITKSVVAGAPLILAGQSFVKPKRLNDSESVRSGVTFGRSRAAAVRLAAERLNAVQRRANLSMASHAAKLTTTARLIQVWQLHHVIVLF